MRLIERLRVRGRDGLTKAGGTAALLGRHYRARTAAYEVD
jgi:hypothetical protein